MCAVPPSPVSHLFLADGLGLLVRVESVRGLHLLDLGDIFLLGLLHRDAVVNSLLPRLQLGLALWCVLVSGVFSGYGKGAGDGLP